MSMVARRIDYMKLKFDFFWSDKMNFKEYYEPLYWKISWPVSKKVAWWAKEKQEWLKWVNDMVLKKAQAQMVKDLEIPVDKLKSMKSTAFDLLIKRINDFIDKKDEKWNKIEWEKVNVKDIRDIINLVKTELWEPTSINKETNPADKEPVIITINSSKPLAIGGSKSKANKSS